MLSNLDDEINDEKLYNKISMSKNSISKLEHRKSKKRKINANVEKMKSVKKLSFFAFLKSMCFDKRGTIPFVSKFRKHLLSEEHLFKSHIKTILLEKEVTNKNGDSTNVFECFNEL